MDLNRRVMFVEKLKRGIAQAVSESGRVDFSLSRQSMITRLAMGFLIVTAHSAWAENSAVDFNRITLPTDLVAAISDVEDDISIPIQGSRPMATAEEIEAPSSESDTIGSETTLPVADTTASVSAAPETGAISAISSTSPAIDINSEDPQLVAGTSISSSMEAPAADSVTPSPESIEQVKKVIQDQPTQEQLVNFNTEIPDIEAEPTKPVATLVATADSADKATTGNEITAAEIVPAETAEQLTQKQDERINEDEIILTWATAWSNNDVEKYLSFYSDDFVPDDPSLNRSSWELLRRERLQNKDIRIIVSNAEVYRADNEITEVRFTQRYTSKSYRDRVIKSIEMKETPGGWKFISERTVETLPFE